MLHRNGPLLARYPPVEGSLGKQYPAVDATLAARGAGDAGPLRMRSPVDGVERFAAVRAVPDYPLAVVVSRDVEPRSPTWRAQAIGTALRTLALEPAGGAAAGGSWRASCAGSMPRTSL